MNIINKRRRMLAVFLLFTIVQSIFPYHLLASNNGPNAPEAAAFEPVDVMDAVNLSTGDLTYVIPLLDVGGYYPLALNYHSGIANNQDASWVGLGWNVNAGTINRNVNGFPDDWKNQKVRERFWNEGEELVQTSIGISYPIGGIDIGLGVSWGSLRGLGGELSISGAIGSVSFNTNGNIAVGVGKKIAPGISANIGYSTKDGFNAGVKLGDKTGNASFKYSTKKGVSGGVGITSGKLSVGMNLSSKGANGFFSIAGAGKSFSNFNSVDNGDITVHSDVDQYFIPLISYTREKVKWYLDKITTDYISGALYLDATQAVQYQSYTDWCFGMYGSDSQEALNNCLASNYPEYNPLANTDATYMDVKELSIGEVSLDQKNAMLPNIDSYNVTSQGMTGMIAPKIGQVGVLEGTQKNFDDFELEYLTLENNDAFKYSSTPPSVYFDFLGELNAQDKVSPILFSDVQNPTSIDDLLSFPASQFSTVQNRRANFIEHFTFANVGSAEILDVIDATNIPLVDENQIRAFRITASDGKVYHYSLPVYSLEERTRTFKKAKNESQEFYEQKRPPYAKYWCLTAITGSDYIKTDPTRNYPDEGDYGYWVRFDYDYLGEDAWRIPSDVATYDEDDENKTYSWGSSQKYYLDKIVSRTHTAFFLKDDRLDLQGIDFSYYHNDSQNNDVLGIDLVKLDRIVSLQNEYADGLIGAADMDDYINQHASEVVKFHYNYELAKGSDNSEAYEQGRLTLKALSFVGKGGVSLIPPYKFEYLGKEVAFDNEATSQWGYNLSDPSIWSLSQIQTPIGSKIKIEYEADDFTLIVPAINPLEGNLYDFSVSDIAGSTILLDESHVGTIQVGDLVEYKITTTCVCGGCEDNYNVCITTGNTLQGTVTNVVSNFEVQVDMPFTVQSSNCYDPHSCNTIGFIKLVSRGNILTGAGIKVKSITTEDETSSFKTKYHYKEIEAGQLTDKTSGRMSYFPADGTYVSYASELPTPVAMYEFIRVESLDALGNSMGYRDYEFNMFKGIAEEESFEDESKLGYLFISKQDSELADFNGYNTSASTFVIEQHYGAIGQAKMVKTFNRSGQLIAKNKSNFEEPLVNDLQVEEQSYLQLKRVIDPNVDANTINLFSSTQLKKVPALIRSNESSQDNLKVFTSFDLLDENTGNLLETHSYSSNGRSFKTTTVPAYTKYVAMGSKVDDPTYKNMLTQQTANYRYLKDPVSGEWNETGVGVTTWNNDWTYREDDGSDETPVEDSGKIWRKHMTYNWNGDINDDGTLANFADDFDWTIGASQTSDWLKTAEITRYNHYSILLESEDMYGSRSSSKMGDNHTKVFSSTNAAYDASFYSGAEDLYNTNQFSGDVSKGVNAQLTDAISHTGKYSINVAAGEKAFVVIPAEDGDYKVSVWVTASDADNARVITPGGTYSPNEGEIIYAGDWAQVNFTIPILASQEVEVTLSTGSGNFDDFRLYPVASNTTSYVYNDWDELTHILASNNMATQYEYDEAGRLTNTYIEVSDFDGPGTGGFILINENSYNYKLNDELDVNGNGIIDLTELYDSLSAYSTALNGFDDPGVLTTFPSGGSGNYSFTYAEGNVTSVGQVGSLTFGSYSDDATHNVNATPPCVGSGCSWEAYAVLVKVKDNVTGSTFTVVNYFNDAGCTCGGGGGGGGGGGPAPIKPGGGNQ